MRTSLLCFALISLVGCSSSKGNPAASSAGGAGSPNGTGGTGTSGGGAAPITYKPSQDTGWSTGLTSGPNGPIPVIVVDQFGYRTASNKVAVLRDPQTGYDSNVDYAPGSTLAVVDQATGTTVKQGTAAAWNSGATDASSGDKAWWFDFSDVMVPGTYAIVDTQNGVRSAAFEINDNVYRSVLKHAVRMYFYQRAGAEKSAATAGADWADTASHLGSWQDPQSHAWTDKTNAALVKDLRGGWFDAGDFNKYTSWTANNVIALLRAYEENPSAFGDDFGIPESGNGVADILDEVKWAVDWLVRMQNDDGSLLCVQGLASGSPPSAAKDPSYYGPATTAASLMGAAVFAYASKVYSAAAQDELKTLGADLLKRAQKAWSWAVANPSVLYYNNDDAKQSGSSGLAAGQQEMDDAGRKFAKLQAAIYLYEQTGDATYKTFVEGNYSGLVASYGPQQWDAEKEEALLYYSQLSGVTDSVKSAIVSAFVTGVTTHADQLPSVTGSSDPYRAPMKDYTWGSNASKGAQARLYELLAIYGGDTNASTANAAAEEYMHYIHGVNPLGLVYLTNMQRAGAENSAKTMFHTWFANGSARWDEVSATTPGPAPGYLVGGPNPSFSLDSCCTAASGTSAYHCYGATDYSYCSQSYSPPLGQPSQKAYLQFNTGWPANSWAVTEPSTGYQASYIRALARFAR